MARNRKTGGRVKGTPNKLTGDLRAMILGALNDAGGQRYLQKQATANPGAFLALIGKTLPKDVRLDGTAAITVTVVTGVPSPE